MESNKLVKLLHTKQIRRVVSASCLLGITLKSAWTDKLLFGAIIIFVRQNLFSTKSNDITLLNKHTISTIIKIVVGLNKTRFCISSNNKHGQLTFLKHQKRAIIRGKGIISNIVQWKSYKVDLRFDELLRLRNSSERVGLFKDSKHSIGNFDDLIWQIKHTLNTKDVVRTRQFRKKNFLLSAKVGGYLGDYSRRSNYSRKYRNYLLPTSP